MFTISSLKSLRRPPQLACLLVAMAMGISIVAADESVVEVTSFGAKSNDFSDTTPALRAALDRCKKSHAAKLVFPSGRFDFWPGRALETYCYITNNDEGAKRVAFPLVGFDNLEIDGGGARFVFHGFLNPFILDHARGITLKNLSIDFARTFHSEGKILETHDDGIDLEIGEQFPYKIARGVLTFIDEEKGGKLVYPTEGLLEFDPLKRETAYMAHDQGAGPALLATEIGPRRIRLLAPKLKGTPGNIMVFGAGHRLVPGITISDSAGIKICGVNIYHCGGMGVVAQRSRDIELERVQVTPTPGSGRVLSITADATHFANCSGKIVMSHCLFENQMDDATNIHGIYARIAQQIGPNAIEAKLVHRQQFGFDFATPGGKVELVHGSSLVTYGEAVVKSVERLNKEYTRVVFAEPLPKEMVIGDAFANAGDYPEVAINHCVIRGNRARGILLGSRGKILIHDNVFHTPGAAILFEGDARFWFEQAGVRDCVIRHNRFENCNYGVWGNACIQVGSGIVEEFRPTSRYNRGIVIEDNTFRIFDPRLLNMYSVDGLTFRGNTIEPSTDYRAPELKEAKRFKISSCENVQIDGME